MGACTVMAYRKPFKFSWENIKQMNLKGKYFLILTSTKAGLNIVEKGPFCLSLIAR